MKPKQLQDIWKEHKDTKEGRESLWVDIKELKIWLRIVYADLSKDMKRMTMQDIQNQWDLVGNKIEKELLERLNEKT